MPGNVLGAGDITTKNILITIATIKSYPQGAYIRVGETHSTQVNMVAHLC